MADTTEALLEDVPILAVRDVVLYPGAMLPITVGRPSSVALVQSMGENRSLAIVSQLDPRVDAPQPKDLYEIGTLCVMHKAIRVPRDNLLLFCEGTARIRIREFTATEPFLRARIEKLVEIDPAVTPEVEALRQNVVSLFQQIVSGSPNLSDDLSTTAAQIVEPARLADFVAGNLPALVHLERQKLLEETDGLVRLNQVLLQLTRELELVELRGRIQSQVQGQLSQSQREFYLREQLKAIQKELGEGEDGTREIEELRAKLEAAGMTPEVKTEALRELDRLARLSTASPEHGVARTYLEWMAALPWSVSSGAPVDVKRAAEILDEDHYDLEKVKDRILDYLAVLQLRPVLKGPILCFVGPPGVGKTSLGMSIAKATGRKFVRMSLGGVRDEAEIRGHRRTYIGALPGQVIQMMKKAGTRNPVFMLDEVEKMSMDFRGDPSAALLEVLDPEQNFMFVDHYLDVEYDLSQVFFIATANVLHTVPPALQDRMEVIRLSGYTEYEKLEIAKRFLVRKQMEQTGLTDADIEFSDDGLQGLIQYYSREAGVRNLEREIGNVCRKMARKVVNAQSAKDKKRAERIVISGANLPDLLGPHRFRDLVAEKKNEIGAAVGLAWTEVGGQILTTEATLMEGKGKLTITGKLGEVMQESAQAAMSYIRSRAHQFGLPRDFYRNLDVHVHIPEGAIPKDGPSAGITMATTICSALTRIPVRGDVAMTGEITLRGKVLGIGGLKEKLLAAHRHGINEAIVPMDNKKDLPEIPENIRNEMTIHFVESMDEVLKFALEREIVALPMPTAPGVEVAAQPEEVVAH